MTEFELFCIKEKSKLENELTSHYHELVPDSTPNAAQVTTIMLNHIPELMIEMLKDYDAFRNK